MVMLESRIVFEMRMRGHREEDIEDIFYNNPCRFYGKNPKFRHKPVR